MASGNLLLPLPRLQRNRRAYNFAGLGIEAPIVRRGWLRPPVQLFQPLSHLHPRRFTSITTFAVWAVEFQEGQQVALPTWLVHNPTSGFESIASKRAPAASSGGNCTSERRTYYATQRGCGFQQNWVKSRCVEMPEGSLATHGIE